jgi:hypothetical protein
MKFHTKCKSQVQREARKVLRSAVQSLKRVQACDPGKLNADLRRERTNHMACMKRIVLAFEKATTDQELLEAMYLARALTEVAAAIPPQTVWN